MGSPLSIAVHVGVVASASAVRHTPPPAAATQRRQPWPASPQLGSTAMPVTRPEVIESLRLSVVAPGANGSSGPAKAQLEPTPARAATSRTPALKADFGSRVGSALRPLRAAVTCWAVM